MLPKISPENKILFLGTALWGWGVDRKEAFAMLDSFVEHGGGFVDTAANYPINKKIEDAGLAVKWLADWIKLNPSSDLSVLIKIGSVNNLGESAVDLTSSAIERYQRYYGDAFGGALKLIAIHFDNRSDRNEVLDTIESFSAIDSAGIGIGFSGLKFPQIYSDIAPALADKWWIQVKENVQTYAARELYEPYFPKARYIAYGINMGGVKGKNIGRNSSVALRSIQPSVDLVDRLLDVLDRNSFTPSPGSLAELALLSSFANERLSGVILGPRNKLQLNNSLLFWKKITLECGDAQRKEINNTLKNMN